MLNILSEFPGKPLLCYSISNQYLSPLDYCFLLFNSKHWKTIEQHIILHGHDQSSGVSKPLPSSITHDFFLLTDGKALIGLDLG